MPEQTDIAQLFARDPLGLSDRDLDAIIDRLRASRKNFLKGDKTAGSMKPKSKAAKEREELKAVLGSVDLSALDL